MNKCIFLDRDGVINKDNPDYVYNLEGLFILPGVLDAIAKFRSNGYKIVVITNQGGIAKGVYTHEDVAVCHNFISQSCNGAIDFFYYSLYDSKSSNSLARKPGTLMFEKAIAKFDIDVTQSWMVGDRARDLVPAKELGIKTSLVENDYGDTFDCNYFAKNLYDFSQYILN